MPTRVRTLSRQLQLRPPTLIRTPSGLVRQLLHRNWRMLPMQFDLPSNSQIFGRIAIAAGVHGIRYPSVRSGGMCIALFPQNWHDSESFVEVRDAVPDGAAPIRLDAGSDAIV